MGAVDYLRYTLIFLVAILVGWAIAIVERAYQFDVPPRHIRLAVLSYIFALIYIAIETYSHLGDQLTWRIPVGFLTIGFGYYSMFVTFRYYEPHRRAYRHYLKSTNALNKLTKERERGEST